EQKKKVGNNEISKTHVNKSAVIESKHIVQKGEKLSTVATKYGKTVGELAEKNKLDSYKLKVGQELIL
ncbi:LysM peptidoglycan-binding domain-containing protein, partial [Listeria innocua]|nr:LysM peptidoglycan-binding domain-containing protein [Listeria innocua]